MVSILVVIIAGVDGLESNGHAHEDYGSMEKDTLVTKLKQVGLFLQWHIMQLSANMAPDVSQCGPFSCHHGIWLHIIAQTLIVSSLD